MSDIIGENIKEVWDYRVSTATPIINTSTGNWVCEVWSQSDSNNQLLESFDTKIKVEPADHSDRAKLVVCFKWFKSVRDKYTRKISASPLTLVKE